MRNEYNQQGNTSERVIHIKSISKKENTRNLIKLLIYGALSGFTSIFFMYACLWVYLEVLYS